MPVKYNLNAFNMDTLSLTKGKKMKISKSEKLILALLCEIHQELGLDKNGEIDSNLISSAINTQNTWAIEQKYDGILWEPEGETPEDVSFVCSVLDMWVFIEDSYKNLSKDEKENLKEKAYPFGSNVSFNGFDGNNESKFLSIARFYIENMNSFCEFSGRSLNSHAPKVETYQRMLEVFEPMRDAMSHSDSYQLSAEQLEQLLKAKKYPTL